MTKENITKYIKTISTDYADRRLPNSLVLGLSGGVDSSVSLYLMCELGLAIRPVYINISSDPDACRSSKDYLDALYIASHFGLKLELVDYSKEYRGEVLAEVLAGYEQGKILNPDILCNSCIKFRAFGSCSSESAIATGHYASVASVDVAGFAREQVQSAKPNFILTPVDATKDQTYFLSSLIYDSSLLSKLFFPLGGLYKNDVREVARFANLPNYNKPDSQGVCLIGTSSMFDFLKSNISTKSGLVLDSSGNTIGRHSGVPFYSIGQRHGFEITKYQGRPLYIIDKNIQENILVVGAKDSCYKKTLTFSNLIFGFDESRFLENFLGGQKDIYARIRNLGSMVKVQKIIKNVSSNFYTLDFIEPVFGINPGQEIVFYEPFLGKPNLSTMPMKVVAAARIV